METDKMWSFYPDTGEVVAFWFGTREHKSLDKLVELLALLEIGKVYADGNSSPLQIDLANARNHPLV